MMTSREEREWSSGTAARARRLLSERGAMNISLITSVPLIPPWDQGDKNLAYALACALPQHRFQVLTARQAPAPPGANLDATPLFAGARPSLLEKAAVYWWFLRQRNRSAPDLYHFVYRPYALSSWLARLVPQFRRRPTLHTVPATSAGHAPARHLFFADRVVTLSRYGQRRLQALGVDNVTYIPPAIPVQQWADLCDLTAELKAELGLGGRPTILFPGHYGPGYGADVMLRALPLIAGALPDVCVIFACRPRHPDDPQRERAARRALAEAGLKRTARFYQTVSDMRLLVGAADVTVLPLETMQDKVDIPTTLLESLAAGKPVVASDLPPMNELFQDGGEGAGCLVPAGDARALAEAVVTLLQEHSLRREAGRRGQALMYERYDVQPVARQYENLYREMIS